MAESPSCLSVAKYTSPSARVYGQVKRRRVLKWNRNQAPPRPFPGRNFFFFLNALRKELNVPLDARMQNGFPCGKRPVSEAETSGATTLRSKRSASSLLAYSRRSTSSLVAFPLGEHVANRDHPDQGRQDGREHQPAVGDNVAYGLHEILQPVQDDDHHGRPPLMVTIPL